jgi:hypothetical protein
MIVRFAAIGAISLTAGCGQQFGTLIYHMGLFPRPTIEAQFILTKGPLLILVEDDYNVSDSQKVRDAIAIAVGDELYENKVNRRVVPLGNLKQLRQNAPEFDKIPTDRLGRMLEAEQVLWIKIVEYSTGDETADDPSQAAQIIVTIRVIHTHAEHRDEVRLWPTGREPYRVEVSESLSMLQRTGLKGMELVLVVELSDQIGKLFYDYKIDRK